MAANHRILALDLPGFGRSDKPARASYSFRYYDRVLEAFLTELAINRVNLVVHDLGGPVGLYWAVQHREKVRRLALLNTLVYPEMSWAVRLFVAATLIPGIKHCLSSQAGLAWAIRFGVENKQRITGEVLRGYQEPFIDKDARRVLLATASRLHPDGLKTIARALPEFDIPVRLIYGENDRILPDIAKTMSRIMRDIPHAQCTPLPGCGHFLQEDAPEHVGQLLAEFLADESKA
jgi:haloalkane dehalogenase